MMELRSLPRENIPALSGVILGFIDRITYHHRFDRLEVLGLLLTGQWQGVFIVEGDTVLGILIYEFREQYGEKTCRLVLASGNRLTKAGELLDSFCNWCKAQGCHFVEGAGRPAWERVLAPHGFARSEVTLRKRL